MPELAEVHYMVNYLRHAGLGDRTIVAAEGADRYMPWDQIDGLVGSKFNYLQPVTRKAKYIIFHLDNGIFLCHNKFTGYWEFESQPWSFDYLEYKRDAASRAHDIRVVLDLDNGDKLFFHDARTLGNLEFYPGQNSALGIRKLFNMGPDVLKTNTLDLAFEKHEWNLDSWFESLLRSRQAIKLFLLDQKIQAGVGNIYACESLLRAGIHPFTPANKVTRPKANILAAEIVKILDLAIKEKILYSKYIMVFRKETCGRCLGPVTRVEQANRGTYFCPQCQPRVESSHEGLAQASS